MRQSVLPSSITQLVGDRIGGVYWRACIADPNSEYLTAIGEQMKQIKAILFDMVGDEDMDMVAAHIGCPTFLVPGPATALATDTPEPTYRGALRDLLTLL